MAVGLTRTSVTNIEKGRQKVRLDTLYDIAEVLGESPQDLLPNASDGRIEKLGADIPPGFSDAEQQWIRSLARGAQPGDTHDRPKEEDS